MYDKWFTKPTAPLSCDEQRREWRSCFFSFDRFFCRIVVVTTTIRVIAASSAIHAPHGLDWGGGAKCRRRKKKASRRSLPIIIIIRRKSGATTTRRGIRECERRRREISAFCSLGRILLWLVMRFDWMWIRWDRRWFIESNWRSATRENRRKLDRWELETNLSANTTAINFL